MADPQPAPRSGAGPDHGPGPDPVGEVHDVPTAPAPAPRSGRNLPVAIASGLVLAGLFIGTLLWDDLAFLTFVAVIVVVALVELGRAFAAKGLRPATPVVLGAGLLAFYGSYTNGPSAQSVALVLGFAGAVAWALLDPLRDKVTASIGASCLMLLWVPFLASFIGLLLARPEGRWYLMATVALSVSTDIGAYAFGSAFGRHKLAPAVSPGKTWEGFAGGLLTVAVIAGLVTARLPGFDLVTALVLGLGVAVASTVGDLAESLVKRDLGVKDLGTVVPGHGGIMDRVDALVFALPTAHLLLLAMGV